MSPKEQLGVWLPTIRSTWEDTHEKQNRPFGFDNEVAGKIMTAPMFPGQSLISQGGFNLSDELRNSSHKKIVVLFTRATTRRPSFSKLGIKSSGQRLTLNLAMDHDTLCGASAPMIAVVIWALIGIPG